ncbi:hypothetical protein LTR84_008827 [Exophiala bonariae]|uniref:Xylanolytic transcriptional activator regulatory domain-containing protein n=1 Tax=Exophiala bonariae TaxID=1690606 RepID=A0AAV9MYT0_9EURO|nr:hypothetical protein LTR84_008827 [Exophiala bonariae]
MAVASTQRLLDETTIQANAVSNGREEFSFQDVAETARYVSTDTVKLPAYILPPQRKFSGDDLQYLGQKGALSIPETELRDQLLRSFILYSYPFLPVVCLEDLLQALEGDGQYQISLMLFQAVMFAGSAFVDELYLHQAGFDDRRSARASFYHKIKERYFRPTFQPSLTVCSFSTILIGSLIESLLSRLCYFIPIGITLGLSERITYAHEDFKTRKLWRRLLWCCYLRDRILSTSARRPQRFRDIDIHIPMLILDDFDLHALVTTIPAVKDALSALTYDCKVALAQMCISQLRLASINGRVVESLYVLQVFGGSTSGPKILYSPKTTEIGPRVIENLECELERWRNQVAQQYLMPQSQRPEATTGEVIYFHQSYLKMLHLLVTEALHRPLSLSRGESTISRSLLQQKSRPVVKTCAIGTAELVKCLRERDLFRFLPPVANTCIGAAVAYFLLEMNTAQKSSENLAGQSGPHLRQCMRGLWSLREVWQIADSTCQIVGHMIRTTEVETARVIGLQASPIVPNVTLAATTESPSSSSTAATPNDTRRGGSQGVGNETFMENTTGVFEHDPVLFSCESSTFDQIDDQEFWSLSSQMPWSLTEFGLSENQFQDGRATGDVFDRSCLV